MSTYPSSSGSGPDAAMVRAMLAPPAAATPEVEGLWALTVFVAGRRAGRGRIEFGRGGTVRGAVNPFLVAIRGFLVGHCTTSSVARTGDLSYEVRFVDEAPDSCGAYMTVTECAFELDATRGRFAGSFRVRTYDAHWTELEVVEGSHTGELVK
jgi:hypothetical protein